MSRRLIVRPEAEAEMTEAYDWYEDRVPGLGSEFLLCVDAVLSSCAQDGKARPVAPFPLRDHLCRGRRACRRPFCFSCQTEPETLAGTDVSTQ